MNGGTSHLDTFDPKPELTKRHLEAPPPSLNIQTFFPNPGTFLMSPFSFKKYGQSGIEVSELFAHTAECIDDIAVVRSIQALSNNHTPAILQMMTGFIQPGRPTVWEVRTRTCPLSSFCWTAWEDRSGGPRTGAPGSCRVSIREHPSAITEILSWTWPRRNMSSPNISAAVLTSSRP